MKTITLKEAYALAATPPLLNNNHHKVQPNIGLLVASLAKDEHNAALLAHAYNVLPGLVAAANEVLRPHLEQPGKGWTLAMKELSVAVDKANQVEVPS